MKLQFTITFELPITDLAHYPGAKNAEDCAKYMDEMIKTGDCDIDDLLLSGVPTTVTVEGIQ